MAHGLYSRIYGSMSHGLYSSISTPWVMDCTVVDLPMTHGLYNRIFTHGPWAAQQNQQNLWLHRSWTVQWCIYPWPMDCTMVGTVCRFHGSWTVQQCIYSMVYGLYNNISTPWVMGCTIVYMPIIHGLYSSVYTHGPWTVQWFRQHTDSMGHGLYSGICAPWVMDCTMVETVCRFHGSWAVQ